MQAIAVTDGRRAKGARGISLETGMGRSGCNSARRNRRNRRARNGPCQRTRIHTVATGVIDNSPAPSRLVNADALGEELKFYPRRPRLKSVRPDQARHFATHTQGLFRVNLDRVDRGGTSIHVRYASKSDQIDASQRSAASCHSRPSAPQQKNRYSITSSARCCRNQGTSRPSALAVLRLMPSSNFVGCSTGISAGFPPCKILTTNAAARRNESGPSAPY